MKTAFDKGYRFVVILNREGVPRHLLYTSPEEFFELDERDIPGSILNLIDKV
jgi:ATP phosphoribosyltransferase regulatory subunit